MLKLRVKSLWHGQVGIHQKYVKKAILEGNGLCFTYQGEQMVIPKEAVRGAIRALSPETFKDRFSGETYKLVYFDWKPTTKQEKLL